MTTIEEIKKKYPKSAWEGTIPYQYRIIRLHMEVLLEEGKFTRAQHIFLRGLLDNMSVLGVKVNIE